MQAKMIFQRIGSVPFERVFLLAASLSIMTLTIKPVVQELLWYTIYINST